MAESTGVIRPQPRNAALGALADFLQRANTAAARVQFNPQIAPQFTLADLLPLEGAAGLMQDVAAYGPRALIKGGNVATGGIGTFRPDPRILDVAEAAAIGAPVARAAARPVGRMAAQQIERAMSEGRGPLGAALAPVRPLNVMKPKGGNWLAGDLSPEAVAQRLKQPLYPGRMPFGHNEQEIAAALGVTPEEVLANADPSSLAINKWLDQKLAKYVRNEMATPEDPLRALAERGVLHVDPEQIGINRYKAPQKRSLYGGQQLGESEAARAWEDATDVAINAPFAGQMGYPSVLEKNPWLTKLDPQQRVYALNTPASHQPEVQGLGFDHLVDELRNAVTPNSGLPRELQLKPEQLSKVTVPQAVELVDRINKWRAAQKAEADLARSTNAATAEYKAYPTIPGTDRPNERGLRWVELRTPEEAGEEAKSALETALKYEGEVMGHCVGGYCPDVIEGKSRIFSLRDARGEPHVTVEVRPDRQRDKYYTDWMRQQPEAIQDEVTAAAIEYNAANPKLGYGESLNKVLRDRIGEVPDEIVQIKGKANRAPKEDYLPFVQDFVRSWQWGRVGDLQNTGLTRVGNSYLTAEELKPLVERASRFLEESPALERHRQAFRAWDEYAGTNPSETLSLQRAAGESVHPTIPYTYLELRSILDDPAAFNDRNYGDALGDNLDRIETLRRLLGEEPGYAEGGPVIKEPSIFNLTDYAGFQAARMFPKDRGEDDRRDAARHMLAAGMLTRKFTPETAERLGRWYEYKESPGKAIGTLFGGSMPPDYDMDTHNNQVGIMLGQQAKDQADLERLVRKYAREAALNEKNEGQAMIRVLKHPPLPPQQRQLYAGGGAVRKGLKGLVERYITRAPQDEALETARKNAVTMLGLPENNTAMDRARAMGFEPQAGFHGTTGDIKKFDKQLLGEATGAQSAQKAFFFARDPQSPPPHMLVKAPASSEHVQMLRRLGIPEKEIAKLNEVSMKGHGAETASGYSALGGSRTYKEATRKARAAEKARNWPEYEKQTEIAEDAEISRNQELQGLVAKYGEARDVMLDRINNAILSKPLPQEEAQFLDARMKNLMPYGWYNSYSIPQLQALKGEIEKLADPGLVNPALKSIDDFISVKANRQLAESYQEGSNVLPAALRYKNPMVYDFGGDAYREQTYADLLDQAKQSGHDALILKNTYDPGAGPAKLIDVLAVFEPSQIRSRFAAFDPARVNEADLLGFADPRLLGLTAAGTAAGLGLRPLFARDEEKQEPQKKAEGGIVRSEFEYDPAAVDARAAALMEEIDAA